MIIPDHVLTAVNTLLEPYGMRFDPVQKTPEPQKNGGFLSMKDAAKYVGLSRAGLYRKVAAGEIPVHKLGERRNCRVVVAKADLDEFVLSHSH